MDLQTLKLNEISESPTNPREEFGQVELAELAADIKQRGLLQPILVRKVAKGYQIIVGHRRYRATAFAEEKTIKAIVVEMTDLEAEEAQVVENEKRDNLKPLEKAKGYAGLIARHGITPDDLALKLGKSRSTVYAVLRLNELLDHGKKALKEGLISESTAKLIARIPASQQVKATKEIVHGRYQGDPPMSYRQALEHVQHEYMLDLRKAVFDTKDAQLVPAAGTCGSCEKRTGAQPGLFEVKVEADLCTDSECWNKKLQQHAANEAVARGVELVAPKDAEKIFTKWGDIQGNDFINADAVCRDDAKERKYSQLLKPDQVKSVGAIAITPKGDLVELLRNDGLKAALEEAGKIIKRPKTKAKAATRAPSAQTLAMKAEMDARQAVFKQAYPVAVDALRAAAGKQASNVKLLQLMVRKAWHWGDYTGDRRGLTEARYHLDEKGFKKHFGAFTAPQLFALLFELVFDEPLGLSDADNYDAEFDIEVVEVAKVLGVDLKKILKAAEAKAQKESTPEQKAEAEAAGVLPLKSAKKSKPKASTPGKKSAGKSAKKKAA